MQIPAEVLYNHWTTSDKELSTPWSEAPAPLQNVFHRQIAALNDAGYFVLTPEEADSVYLVKFPDNQLQFDK